MSRIIKASVWSDEPCIVEVEPPAPPAGEGAEDEPGEDTREDHKEEDADQEKGPDPREEAERLAREAVDAAMRGAKLEIRNMREKAESEISATREAMMSECLARKKEAEELLTRTKNECSAMKLDTEQESKDILSDAHEQAELLMTEAKKKGHEEGLAEGRKEGSEQIRAEQKQIILDANAKAEKTLADAKEECRVYVENAENIIASLAMEIADKVLPQHFIDVPQIVLPLIKKALMKVKDQSEVNVRVSPDNYDLVLIARSEFQNMLEGNAILEVHSDENLGPGDVVIETPNGNVDARLSTQLELIKKSIQDVMS